MITTFFVFDEICITQVREFVIPKTKMFDHYFGAMAKFKLGADELWASILVLRKRMHGLSKLCVFMSSSKSVSSCVSLLATVGKISPAWQLSGLGTRKTGKEEHKTISIVANNIFFLYVAGMSLICVHLCFIKIRGYPQVERKGHVVSPIA